MSQWVDCPPDSLAEEDIIPPEPLLTFQSGHDEVLGTVYILPNLQANKGGCGGREGNAELRMSTVQVTFIGSKQTESATGFSNVHAVDKLGLSFAQGGL